MQIDPLKKIKLNGEKFKIAIILPYFNESLGLQLLENTQKELKKHKVKKIDVIRVAGALEIPFACIKIHKKYDAIIALGVIIRGKTSHYDLVCQNTFQGIMNAQLETWKPIIFGIITAENITQAKKRLNKGAHSAQAALIQANL